MIRRWKGAAIPACIEPGRPQTGEHTSASFRVRLRDRSSLRHLGPFLCLYTISPRLFDFALGLSSPVETVPAV